MSSNPELVAQVRITNVTRRGDGELVPKVLSIKASRLKDYIDQLKLEANKTYTPNKASEFDYLPLLSLWDLADTGEQVFFDNYDDLPSETVFNSKGIPLLVIVPEGDDAEIGLNRFDVLPKKKLEIVNEHLRTIKPTPFKLVDGKSKVTK